MDWFLSAYKSKGGVNSGIYNCRSVRGGKTTSLHGEGRAADFGIRPYSAAYGTQLANAIVKMSKELGVQCVIWNRKIWSSSYPDRWRRYTGVASHRDHIHVEFMWWSAKQSRAEARKLWNRVLGGGGGGGSATYREVKYGDLLKLHTKGAPVREWQKVVGVKADGYFGPSTVSATKKWQKAHGLAADGIVGPKTWAKYKSGGSKKGKSVPGPRHPFPLPSGYYFGPKSGGDKSVSGHYGRRFKGVKDSSWLIRFCKQLLRRGWSVGKGKSYLTKYGIDGLYGPELEALIRAFQRDQGLAVDGLLGRKTWDAAYRNPVT